MKTQFITAVALLCAVITGPLIGQNLSSDIRKYPGPFEVSLGNPNYREGTQVIPVGIDLWEGNEVNTIYYGRTPSNSSSKPVLLFVHGYASNAQVFFKGEDNMYADVYRDGYRSAYVSLTPNDDMWTNGYMLAKMITKIKSHYNNAPLVLIGWSKGGVDIDAALVHFGANSKVSEVFTLSTPHFGTGIAELANSQLLSLVNIIFMQNNDATLSLQRGYMNYFRSITDGNSKNTVPYTTIGGWGNGPLNRLDIPQGILHLIDGGKDRGGNDGVVPYPSSIRPGAKELFGGLEKKYGIFGPYYDGPDETNLDHFEVTRGGKVWPFIKSELRQSSGNRNNATNIIQQNPNRIISSRTQWIQNTNDDYVIVSSNTQNSKLITLSNHKESITLINSQNQNFTLKSVLTSNNDVNAQVFDMGNILPGRYQIESKEPIVFMVEEGGPEMILDVKQQILQPDISGLLDIDLSFKNLKSILKVDVEAYLVPSVGFDLNRMEPRKIPLLVQRNNNQFHFYVDSSLKEGIYQMMVRSSGKDFKRDILTSLAIGEVKLNDEESVVNSFELYPNPAQESVTIRLSDIEDESKLTIYTMRGEVVFKAIIQPGQPVFQWYTQDQHSGLYIIELQQNDKKLHKKLMIDN